MISEMAWAYYKNNTSFYFKKQLKLNVLWEYLQMSHDQQLSCMKSVIYM